MLMANNEHKIVVNAEVRNFSSFKKEITDAKKLLDTLSKNKVGIKIDDSFLKNYKKNFTDLKKVLEDEIKKQINLLKSYDDAIDKTGNKLKNIAKINSIGARLSDYQKTYQDVGGGGGGDAGGGGGTGGAEESGGGGGGRGRGVISRLGVGRYLTLYGAYRLGKKLYDTEFGLASGRMGLKGLGANNQDIEEVQKGGNFAGYTQMESLQQALEMKRATGSLQGMKEMQLFSRISGYGMDELTGVMSGFRQSGMRNSESVKMIKDIYTEAIRNGFDESRAIEILQSISEYTGAMSEKTGINVESVRSIIEGLMGSSEFFSQNAGRSMTAMQGAAGLFGASGNMSAISYRALKALNPNASFDELLRMRTLGLTGQEGGAGFDIYNQMLEQLGTATAGHKVKFGGGLQQMNGKMGHFAAVIKSAMGLPEGQISEEIAKSFLTGDKTKLLKSAQDVNKSINEKMLDIMNSEEKTLLQIAANTKDIADNTADDAGNWLKDVINDWNTPATNPDTGKPWGGGAEYFKNPDGSINTDAWNKAAKQEKQLWRMKNGQSSMMITNPQTYQQAASNLGLAPGGGGGGGFFSTLFGSKGGGNAQIMKEIDTVAQKYNVDKNLMKAYIKNESNFKTGVGDSTNPTVGFLANGQTAGGAGIGQFIPSTFTRLWKKMGIQGNVDLSKRYDPHLSLEMLGYYFKEMQSSGMSPKAMMDSITGVGHRGSGGPKHVADIMRDYKRYQLAEASQPKNVYDVISNFLTSISKATRAQPAHASHVTHRAKHKKMQDE